MAKKKVLIMAGGTGGHIFPALACAKLLVERGFMVEWLGSKKGMEARLIPQYDYPIHYIDIGGLRGKGIKTLLLLPFRLLRALVQTLKVYKTVQPDVVLGMGGFVTGTGGVVAWLKRIPLIVHEQNAIAGLTNKLLFKLAQTVFAAFPTAFSAHQKLSVIGNPIRKEISDIEHPNVRLRKKWSNDQHSSLNVLLIGGSLGAQVLNETLPQALAIMRQNTLKNSVFKHIHVRHQCGANHIEATKENYRVLTEQDFSIENKLILADDLIADCTIEVLPFIDNIADNYAWADFIICRSGALTVSEISAVGVASLLVPYPYAVDDHQTANAAYLADADAAFLVQQSHLNALQLANMIQSLNQDVLLTMAIKARQLLLNNAAQMVADKCLEQVE
jgi:UDP-N-acetylglucosamine--N-acetylmuramyl-(pentapeptide) pyrophosphoryl-undecaprenol N-acetylglucosamine transferase